MGECRIVRQISPDQSKGLTASEEKILYGYTALVDGRIVTGTRKVPETHSLVFYSAYSTKEGKLCAECAPEESYFSYAEVTANPGTYLSDNNNKTHQYSNFPEGTTIRITPGSGITLTVHSNTSASIRMDNNMRISIYFYYNGTGSGSSLRLNCNATVVYYAE